MGKVSESAVTRGLTFGVNIRNLFDSDPPFVNLAPAATGGGGFDPTLASPIGRLVALSVSKKF
jgi:iron complex outermembrane receptor protein